MPEGGGDFVLDIFERYFEIYGRPKITQRSTRANLRMKFDKSRKRYRSQKDGLESSDTWGTFGTITKKKNRNLEYVV